MFLVEVNPGGWQKKIGTHRGYRPQTALEMTETRCDECTGSHRGTPVAGPDQCTVAYSRQRWKGGQHR